MTDAGQILRDTKTALAEKGIKIKLDIIYVEPSRLVGDIKNHVDYLTKEWGYGIEYVKEA